MKSKQTKPVTQNNLIPRIVKAETKFINMDFLNEISVGSQEFIHVFLATFRDEARRSIVSLKHHLQNNDLIFLEKTAHAMKPTGVYVGSPALSLLVGLLEKAAHGFDQKEVSRLVPQVVNMTENILNEIDEYLK